ncbi:MULTISPECIES: hypothetical protein [Streptomyces]|uniref:hypothetical protein n=1 Tax=Streptomyces TaxID=1883 RepID=UPI002E2D41C1|nr:hypothetical protein [[Kitasatospora] papulosa]
MKQVLNVFQYAARVNRRTIALALASAATAAVIAAVVIWAPPERAALVVALIGPILAAIVVSRIDTRRRSTRS